MLKYLVFTVYFFGFQTHLN